jgi:hypothetical protein
LHCRNGLLHRIVNFQDYALRPVFAMLRFVLAPERLEGVEDVIHVFARNAVKVKVSRIEF